MQIFTTSHNILKEKELLLEKDFRANIKKTFQVTDEIADFAHNINDKLSLWIVDSLFKQLIKERHFIRSQVITFLNTPSDDKNNYLRLFQDKIVSVLDYYANPIGKEEYNTFDKFKKEDFDVLYQKSDEWHKSLKSRLAKTTEIKDTEEGVIILKQYEPTSSGIIYYWADLNKTTSDIESSRMGHCGHTNKGTTLLSLRSFTPTNSGSYISKSHITLSVNRQRKYYTQCKGKQNRKPSINYRQYIFDIFLLDKDIKGYEAEYNIGTDFLVSDLTSAQIKSLIKTKPKLVEQFISPNFIKFQEDIKTLSAKEVYTTYVENLDSKIIQSFKTRSSSEDMVISQVITETLPIIIKDNSVFNDMITKYINFDEDFGEKDEIFTEEGTIIDYCIFSNTFAKIKNRIDYFMDDNFSEDEKINIISNFCYYSEQYPDYFSPYSSKVVIPIMEDLLTNETDVNNVEDIYGEHTVSVVKKLMLKDKDKYKNLLYVIYYDELKDFLENQYENGTPNELEELIKKINEINFILKGSPSFEKFQKEIMNLSVFKNSKFKDVQIFYLYYKDPSLINYSYYSDFDSNFINETITKKIHLSDVPIYYQGEKVDIVYMLERLLDYIESADWSEIEYYLDDVERKKKKKEDYYIKVYDRIVSAIEKETGKKYSEILKEYDISSLSDAIKNLNDNDQIDNVYMQIQDCLRYAYESSIVDEYEKKYLSALEEYISEVGIKLDESSTYLHENKAVVYLSVKELLNIFEESGEENDYDLEIETFSSLLSSYIYYQEERLNYKLYADFDRVYGDYNTVTVSDYIMSEL